MNKISMIVVAGVAAALFAVRPVSADDNGQAGVLAADPHLSSIYVYRKGRIVGMGVTLQAFIDGRFIGTIDNKEYRLVKVPPGEHVIDVLAHENQQSLIIDTEAGGNYYVRLDVKAGLTSPRVKLAVEEETKARKDILKLEPLPPFTFE